MKCWRSCWGLLDSSQIGSTSPMQPEEKIQGADSTRRPDVQVVGPDGKVVKVVEVERRPNSQRHTERQKEYDRLGVPHETVPLPKKKPGENQAASSGD